MILLRLIQVRRYAKDVLLVLSNALLKSEVANILLSLDKKWLINLPLTF